VPVATVAIDNATNAALLAIRILATADEALALQVRQYSATMEAEVQGKRERMVQTGWEAYTAA
jgi:phosphoribosylaminoimidazole carboxylase